jgi:hypothetical protein
MIGEFGSQMFYPLPLDLTIANCIKAAKPFTRKRNQKKQGLGLGRHSFRSLSEKVYF